MSRVIADGLSKRVTATTQEAEDAVEGKYPDADGVHAAFNQYGLGGPTEVLTDPDVHLVSGFYGVNGSTNNPGFSTYNILASRWGPDSRWVTQLAQQVNGNRLAHRAVQSGTGSYAGWTELYTEANILGPVSQSAGVPTGAIIERGSNANGEYVKFADGTLICHGSLSVGSWNTAENLSDGGDWQYTNNKTFNFPAIFTGIPFADVKAPPQIRLNSMVFALGGASESTFDMFAYSIGTHSRSTAFPLYFSAIGRWW